MNEAGRKKKRHLLVIGVCLSSVSCHSDCKVHWRYFQELMTIVLQDLEGFATVYLDDILIYSKSLEEHLIHIQNVFDRLRQYGVKLKLKKCQFLQDETSYLGFVINWGGNKPCGKKLEAIKALPVPTCVRECRSFIGMCNYRRFIPNTQQ